MYRLAIKSLLRRKTRTALSVLGIAVGIAMIVCLVSISEGMRLKTLEFSNLVGDSIFVVKEDLMGSPTSSEIDADVVEKLEKIPGVDVAAALVIVEVEIKGYQSASAAYGFNFIYIAGIEPEKEKIIQFGTRRKLIAGRLFSKDEKGAAVIGSVIASELNKNVGDTLDVYRKGEKYTFDIVGIYETGTKEEDEEIYINLKEAQDMKGLPKSRISAVDVKPTNAEYAEELARKIKFMVAGVDASYAKQMMEQLSDFVKTIELTTWIIAGVSAFVGGIGIANTMVMSVMEQTKEIGVLKAVGWYSRDVMKLILLEAILISVIGAVVGTLIGAIITFFILPTFLTGFISPVITPRLLVSAVSFALFLGLLGGILPARSAARMDPVIAFREL